MSLTGSGSRMEGDQNLQSMLVGSVMRKIKSRSWKKQRYFKLQDDFTTIWSSSKKAGNAHSTFSVGDVEAVRHGHQSEVLLSIADQFPAARCFTLVFRGRRPNLDLVAESEDEARSWVQGMRKLMENLENMGERERLDHWIGDWFRKADKNNDGRMNFREVQDLLKMMNVEMDERRALRLFTKADKSQSGSLEDDEFVLFYKMLTQRDDVLRVFQEFSSDGHKLSRADLEDFLRQEQLEAGGGQDVRDRAQRLIRRYEPSEAARRMDAMTVDGFLMYLGSAEGSIFNPSRTDVFQDMSRPLCHYFISSSHNTYLMEDQLRGQSSVEGYIRALTRGCRCVEVDCWDGANGEPVVYHGHTFTSKILFRDVLSAVAGYAFKVSQFPVILSLENHCSLEQQQVLARHLDRILGDKLLRAPLEDCAPLRLPSPQELRGKILLKAKKMGGLEDGPGGAVEDGSGGAVEDGPGGAAEDGPGGDLSDDDADVDEDDDLPRESVRRRAKKSKQRLSKELSDCVVYCKSVRFSSFRHARVHAKFYEVASFTESKARKHLREAGADFVRHNSRQLTRVYPSGFRTDSSNFNPQEMWNAGCQIERLLRLRAEARLHDGPPDALRPGRSSAAGRLPARSAHCAGDQRTAAAQSQHQGGLHRGPSGPSGDPWSPTGPGQAGDQTHPEQRVQPRVVRHAALHPALPSAGPAALCGPGLRQDLQEPLRGPVHTSCELCAARLPSRPPAVQRRNQHPSLVAVRSHQDHRRGESSGKALKPRAPPSVWT